MPTFVKNRVFFRVIFSCNDWDCTSHVYCSVNSLTACSIAVSSWIWVFSYTLFWSCWHITCFNFSAALCSFSRRLCWYYCWVHSHVEYVWKLLKMRVDTCKKGLALFINFVHPNVLSCPRTSLWKRSPLLSFLLICRSRYISQQKCVCNCCLKYLHVFVNVMCRDIFFSLHGNIAFHVVPAYRASTYLVSAFPAHSTSFSQNFCSPQRWNVYQVVNQNLYLGYILFHPDMTLHGWLGIKHQVLCLCLIYLHEHW